MRWCLQHRARSAAAGASSIRRSHYVPHHSTLAAAAYTALSAPLTACMPSPAQPVHTLVMNVPVVWSDHSIVESTSGLYVQKCKSGDLFFDPVVPRID